MMSRVDVLLLCFSLCLCLCRSEGGASFPFGLEHACKQLHTAFTTGGRNKNVNIHTQMLQNFKETCFQRFYNISVLIWFIQVETSKTRGNLRIYSPQMILTILHMIFNVISFIFISVKYRKGFTVFNVAVALFETFPVLWVSLSFGPMICSEQGRR